MIAVDVHEGHPLSHDQRWLKWLREHGITPERTYRVEIKFKLLKLRHVMTVFQYALNKDGRKYYDHDLGHIAFEEPYDVDLLSAPPA